MGILSDSKLSQSFFLKKKTGFDFSLIGMPMRISKPLYDIFICFQLHINIMAFIKRLRNQNWLFPPTIADLIEEDHICRLVEEVVESIDFKSIEEKYDGPGSPAYHPKVMMKLLIQGTIDAIRSSRKI